MEYYKILLEFRLISSAYEGGLLANLILEVLYKYNLIY